MFKKNKKGFTLIELMVVIAIIAILATIVLIALQGARDAAEDSKRKAGIAQIRALANIEYALGQDDYSGLIAKEGDPAVFVNSELKLIADEHEDHGLVVVADGDKYCASVTLKTKDSHFCVSYNQPPKDYKGSTSETCVVGTGNTFQCADNE
jgi:prepilin-type N-terminal cleavage/methylation domain-containing protein